MRRGTSVLRFHQIDLQHESNLEMADQMQKSTDETEPLLSGMAASRSIERPRAAYKSRIFPGKPEDRASVSSLVSMNNLRLIIRSKRISTRKES